MTIPDWIARAAATRPAHLALVADGERLSFAALEVRVRRLAAGLRAAGAIAGIRVGALLPNGLDLATLVHAAPRLGVALVLLDPRSTPGEIARLVRLGEAALVVTAETTAAAARDVPCSVRVERLLDAGASLEPPGVDLDRPHTVVFTSGTSGEPKPVVLSAGNHLWSAFGSAARLGAPSDERWLCALPCWHVGGLAILLRAAVFAQTVVLQAGFAVDAVLDAVEREQATMLSLVPTTLARVAVRPAPRSLRVVLVGGASASADLLRAAAAKGWPVAPTYGCTEAASQIATAAPGSVHALDGSVGLPLMPTRVRIVDPAGDAMPAGDTGAIEVQGPTLSAGVLGHAGHAVRDGWHRTGDLGRLALDGALTVLGRSDDVIVTGGENVAPTEVEEVLAGLAGVAEVAVAGVPDERWGRAVAAWVVPRGGAAPTLEAVRAAARTRLAAHKLPTRLYVVETLPRTAAGKVRRVLLQPPEEA